MAPGFITNERLEQAKREGWLPAIPEITVDWIMQHAEQMKKVRRANASSTTSANWTGFATSVIPMTEFLAISI